MDPSVLGDIRNFKSTNIELWYGLKVPEAADQTSITHKIINPIIIFGMTRLMKSLSTGGGSTKSPVQTDADFIKMPLDFPTILADQKT